MHAAFSAPSHPACPWLHSTLLCSFRWGAASTQLLKPEPDSHVWLPFLGAPIHSLPTSWNSASCIFCIWSSLHEQRKPCKPMSLASMAARAPPLWLLHGLLHSGHCLFKGRECRGQVWALNLYLSLHCCQNKLKAPQLDIGTSLESVSVCLWAPFLVTLVSPNFLWFPKQDA